MGRDGHVGLQMGYCKEHFSNHERDLVDSVDKELCGEDNPYAKTWGT